MDESGSSKYLQHNLAEIDNENCEEYVPQKKIKGEDSDEEVNESSFNTQDLHQLDTLSEEFLNRVVIHSIVTQEACTHDVAVPPGYTYQALLPMSGKPAKEYKFTLDPFQKESILCIHNNQSVLVSAHTSAGKTVVAEYAIASSLANKQRVIYTTPIKALSNQKYREFFNEFQDVGLITGDVTINVEASCLIMTTEILRNMLYRGSEIIRQVGWVIFDEIHYMRNLERGVVWEESLILLPDNVHYVFLSATIPNARQFAEWVCHLHKQPCHVVYSDFRPTPLQHFLFPAGAQGIYMIVDENGEFKEDSFKLAMDSLLVAGDSAKGDQFGRQGGLKMNPTETNIFKIVKLGVEHKFAPMICFSFSKKECEVYAMQMAKLDFNDASEKKLVEEVFENAMEILSADDKKLPAVNNLLPLLLRGIGIHHGGLLPILKEIVEILFGEGLLKVLFATETFAMGLNMPARTVIFTGIRKFDGKNMRSITSGEYIQMSGRAGRRGLDSKGIVILMVDEKVTPKDCRDLVQGDADPINSAFHLTYNMVLNLLRVEEINPEYMLERSFFQFQNQAKLPYLLTDYRKKLMDCRKYKFANESEIQTYYNIRQSLADLETKFHSFISMPKYIIPFLSPGRLVKVKLNDVEQDWGVVVNFKKQMAKRMGTEEIVHVSVHVLLKINTGVKNENNDVEVVQIEHQNILKISAIRLNLPKDLTQKNNKTIVMKTICEAKIRLNDNIPLLDPIEDMGIKEKNFLKTVENIKYFEKKLFEHKLHSADNLADLYTKYDQKIETQKQLDEAKRRLTEAKSLIQLDELKKRKRVLRRLGFSSSSDVIEIKGRIACELTSGDELLMTELIFNGFFNNLTAAQCAALLSSLVCDEKCLDVPKLSNEMSRHLNVLKNIAKTIAKCVKESGLSIDEDTYVESFKPSLIDVTYAWATGLNFLDLCKMTEIFEGSIIRCMRRLEELLRQMIQAAKSIGNAELEERFSEAIKLIKRDIIFASSLYL